MKKIYLSIIIVCCLVFTNTSAQTCSLSLQSAVGTDSQTVCKNSPITTVIYSIYTATNVSVTGLPAGVTGKDTAGQFLIRGTPTVSGTYDYTVTPFGNCTTQVSMFGRIVSNAGLTSAAGTDSQSPCINTAITDITYEIAGGGSIGASGLPAGVFGGISGTMYTINGTPTASGKYTYTISTSGGSCSAAPSITGTISVIPLPTATLSGTGLAACLNSSTSPKINFNAASSGSATNLGPYTFTYKINGGSSQTINTVAGYSVSLNAPTSAAGSFIYSLVGVHDGTPNLCSQAQTGTYTVTINSLPTGTLTATGAPSTICENKSGPNITFAGSGSTPPYTFTYTINGGSNKTVTTASGNTVTIPASTSVAGSNTYALVSVKDANTCSQTQTSNASFTVKPFAVNILTNNQSAANACNGYLEAVAKGTSPFTYMWADNVANTTAYRNNVCAGKYSVIVKDSASKCIDTAYAYIGNNTVSSPLVLSISSNDATADNQCDGAARVKVSGGGAPYDIYFGGDTVHTSPYMITQLCSGFYTVNATDGQSHSTSFTFVVGSPSTSYRKYHPEYQDSVIVDTLVTNAVSTCTFDYGAHIDSIKITDFKLVGHDSIKVTWTIYQGTISVHTTQLVQYGNISSPGVYVVILDLYCTNRTSGSVRASDEIVIDNRVIGITPVTAEVGPVVYPNPFTNKLSVEAETIAMIKVVDINGKEVYSGIINPGKSTIDTGNFTSGIYFVTIVNDKTSVTKKLIKN